MKEVLAKIFGGAGVGVAEKLSNIIGQHVFSKEEKARFEKEMTEVFINAEQEQQKSDALNRIIKSHKRRMDLTQRKKNIL